MPVMPCRLPGFVMIRVCGCGVSVCRLRPVVRIPRTAVISAPLGVRFGRVRRVLVLTTDTS